ncbi:DUF2169 family type VI secretion system accessory protein [Polyangium sorediatum]|uniref:DUF2169 domain-containing protein n=1 Tax=Polyangium sorediatum TaxID=889274 RepID=A0ABT6NPA0_9BACT|nr:DUF2169 domain-containing protein [Polyangium sorediatum]MDI1430148.1 DUF2169 domain-containing protein [Polyangium sorediatum]
MDVLSLCPLRARGFIWQSHAGTHAQTIVVKATFVLVPGVSLLAPEEDQEPPNDDDAHWDDDPARSVVAPSDRVPYKPRADVMLVGHAYAPGEQPVRSLVARLLVGELDKSLEVWCDRGFRLQDGQLREGPRFTKMPLRWERAAGGPDTNNPVGIPFGAAPDRHGLSILPNLQPMGTFVSERSDTFAPVGFGPVGATWPGRLMWLGGSTGHLSQAGWEEKPLPEGVNCAYFQAAPPDQQVPRIRANERIVLEHLHPEHARLVTNLPGLKPRVVAERASGEREEVALVADTLWIDTDRAICVVTWRGSIGLRHKGEAGRIVVTLEAEGGAAKQREQEGDAEMTLAPGFGPTDIAGPVLPFVGGNKTPECRQRRSTATPEDVALPFGKGGISALRARPSSPLPSGDATLFPSGDPKAASAAPGVAPPPFVFAPAPTGAPITSSHASPWAGGDGPDGRAAPSLSIGQRVAHGNVPSAPAKAEDVKLDRVSSPAEAQEKPETSMADAALGGAAAASHAAARAGAGLRRPVLARASVELIWLNAGSMQRIRKQVAWKELVAGVKVRPEDEDLEDDVPAPRRTPAKDRREVLTILSKGEALDVPGVEGALYQAMEDEGGFTPPLVLVGGLLEMQFDELELLKATLAALSPHVLGDKRLEDAVGRVQEMMKMPWSSGASGVLEEAAVGLRGQFLEGKKGAAAAALDVQVERALLEQRHWRKRAAFGQMRVVGHLLEASGKGRVPVYLPESLGKELPAIRRMEVRVIGEVRPRVEQGEMHPAAVRGVAVGRGVG